MEYYLFLALLKEFAVKVVGYKIEPGQAFLTTDQWQELVHDIYYSKDLVVDITRGDT